MKTNYALRVRVVVVLLPRKTSKLFGDHSEMYDVGDVGT